MQVDGWPRGAVWTPGLVLSGEECDFAVEWTACFSAGWQRQE